jgi:leucyl aminopeptidase (aminopeptidase T)
VLILQDATKPRSVPASDWTPRGLCATVPAASQTPGEAAGDLARRVVQAAGGVAPGEIVLIDGGRHAIPFMEAVAIEVIRAGAVPAMYVRTDAISRAYYFERALPLVQIADSADASLYGHELQYASVFINFPQSPDGDALWTEVSADTARMRVFTASWEITQARIDSLRNRSRARFVYVNYPPMRGPAARSGMDSASFARMQWGAVTADYGQIDRAGRAIAGMMERGRVMRITTPAGTDLRLPLMGRPAAVNSGIMPTGYAQARLAALRTVSLPGGQVSVAPAETTASGRVVLPRAACGGGTLVNARFRLQAGILTDFAADSGGACVTRYLARNSSPANRLGYVVIGLNPALRPAESGGYYPWSASGLVHIGVGNNADLGGANSTPAGQGFVLTGATVEIDGIVIVRNGQLNEAVLRSANGGGR